MAKRTESHDKPEPLPATSLATKSTTKKKKQFHNNTMVWEPVNDALVNKHNVLNTTKTWLLVSIPDGPKNPQKGSRFLNQPLLLSHYMRPSRHN